MKRELLLGLVFAGISTGALADRDELEHRDVLTRSGQEVGEVEDVLTGINGEKYLVVELEDDENEGVFGFEDEEFVVPMAEAEIGEDGIRVRGLLEERSARLFQEWAGEDGQLTVSEWDTGVDQRFGEAAANLSAARWDEDSNEVISRQEFENAFEGELASLVEGSAKG